MENSEYLKALKNKDEKIILDYWETICNIAIDKEINKSIFQLSNIILNKIKELNYSEKDKSLIAQYIIYFIVTKSIGIKFFRKVLNDNDIVERISKLLELFPFAKEVSQHELDEFIKEQTAKNDTNRSRPEK